MSLRFHEIAETSHRILNPFTEDQLMLLGDICRLHSGMSLLDLACGKAELLCRWAQQYEITGVGVDMSAVFLDAARKRAGELDVLTRSHSFKRMQERILSRHRILMWSVVSGQPGSGMGWSAQ